MNNKSNYNCNGRRKFLSSITKLAAASVIMAVPSKTTGAIPRQPRSFTVKEVIDIILKEVPGAPFAKTVDQLRSGSMQQIVTGIVTTTFPTIDVIEKTAKAGANFIIAHETPFYNNEDETDWLQQDDAYRYKIQILNKYKIAIWRFHDYWHSHKPDGIIFGTLKKLGWERYYDVNNQRILTLPQPVPLQSIVTRVKQKLGISSIRVVGNLRQNCSTVYLAFGYMDSKRQIAAIQQYRPDVILSGETREWETVERVRDGLIMRQKTSLLVLSHAVSEEAGMEYAASWLRDKVPGTRITHIAAQSPFVFR